MIRCYSKFAGSAAMVAVLIVLSAVSCSAFNLLSPAEGQAVRENAKIQVPANVVPDGGFISVLVEESGSERFVVAISRSSAKEVNNTLVFYWNTKAPYYLPSNPSKPLYLKDGPYPVKIQAHDAKGKCIESAVVHVQLKNRVARTNPAPGVSLVNRLSFGQVNEYGMHSEVGIFEDVNGIGLPLLGGLALAADEKIVQSVEDARPGGVFLMRYRVDDKAYVSSRGIKNFLFTAEVIKPQLYRLMSNRGKVLKGNMFAKQARFYISDILPVLPTQSVKEGDSWPDQFGLRIDGLTAKIDFKGTTMLDSFEWQNGQECAKLTSSLTGNSNISLANGKIKSAGPIKADVTTYFAYKTGKMLYRDIKLSFKAIVMPGAGDDTGDQAQPGPVDVTNPAGASSPFEEDNAGAPSGASVYSTQAPPAPGTNPYGNAYGITPTPETLNKKGFVEIDVVVKLEK